MEWLLTGAGPRTRKDHFDAVQGFFAAHGGAIPDTPEERVKVSANLELAERFKMLERLRRDAEQRAASAESRLARVQKAFAKLKDALEADI